MLTVTVKKQFLHSFYGCLTLVCLIFIAVTWHSLINFAPIATEPSRVLILCISISACIFAGLIAKIVLLMKQQMYALETRTFQLKAILDTAPSAIITTDNLGNILTFNAAAERIFGYTVQELIGTNVKCLMPKDIAKHHDDFLRNFKDTGQSKIIGKQQELEAKRKNGDSFPIQLHIKSMIIAGKLFFFGAIDDMSETRTLQNQLVQAQKLEAIGQLASGVAHEINTPIQYIGDNLSALNDNFADIIAYQRC